MKDIFKEIYEYMYNFGEISTPNTINFCLDLMCDKILEVRNSCV